MGPQDLSQVLRKVDFKITDDKVLVGLDKGDDAIAYQFSEDKVIVQSVDFFTPIVDDPYLFGQIAAANSLSDIYAMGGKPILAMNIVGFPSCLDATILTEILQGGADKAAEAGAIIAGGHTIKDDEPKYGLSVTGVVEPEHLLTNSQAQIGDKLILTKPLGMGIISTAIKNGLTSGGLDNLAVEAMATLNNKPASAMKKIGVNSCTDITGFGFLGHAWEIARGSNVKIRIFADEVPIFPDVLEYVEMGLVPGGAYSNQKYLTDNGIIGSEISDALRDVFFDPQTSGGLLISVAEDKAASLLAELYSSGVDEAAIVGEVTGPGSGIRVTGSGG